MYKKTSIMEIFNDPDYEAGNLMIDSNEELPVEMVGNLESLTPVKFCQEIVETALKAQKKWKTLSPQLRANALHQIWTYLKDFSELLVKPNDCLSLFIDYFDFYCDVLLQTEEYTNCRPQGVVLIVLLDHSPLLAVAATVPAALAAGCSVIVAAPTTNQTFLLALEAMCLKAGLPEGVFKVVIPLNETDGSVVNKISKVLLCGSYSLVQEFYTNILVKSFNFFCPNNTAAIVHESADLNAAVDKIIAETWGKEHPVFAVSNIIVQESIYLEFFDKLKYKMNQFMTENKNSLKFKDLNMSMKIQNLVSEALRAGATVEEAKSCGDWNPTVIVDYQNQDTKQDVPVLKLLLCRTAKEGVTLLNNCRFTLGISVWSEIASQALEISSKLISPNIWINCHGQLDAGVPLQLSGSSGNCVLGGSDGILEYASFRTSDLVEELQGNEDGELSCEELLGGNGKEVILAQQAFTTWQHNKNRRQFLKQIANSLSLNLSFEHLSEIIHYYAHSGHLLRFTDRSSNEEFSFIRNKIPIGVILLIINTSKIDVISIVSLIAPALAFGNAVIILLKTEDVLLQSIIKSFTKILPRNVLNVVVGLKHGIHLVSDPNIQAVWLYNETVLSKKLLEIVRCHSARNLKHLWVVPEKVPISHKLFQKECLQDKVVWLTKIDQFP